MTAQPQPAEPDDLMAIADAVGVTAGPAPIHPAVRAHVTDANLDAVVSAWARAYAAPQCSRCQDTGLVEDRHWRTGEPFTRGCTDCGGETR